jgi:hypothetical protein
MKKSLLVFYALMINITTESYGSFDTALGL